MARIVKLAFPFYAAQEDLIQQVLHLHRGQNRLWLDLIRLLRVLFYCRQLIRL